jgi:hypothetical protein
VLRRALAACVMLGAACSDLTSVPGGPQSLSLDSLPFTAVVVGDTLRDTLGVAHPLSAKVYDGANKLIAGAPVRFLSLDTGVVLDSITGRLIGVNRRTGVRLLASVSGLQTSPKLIVVANRPDTASNPDTIARLVYVTVPRNDPANSFSLRVKVGSQPLLPGTSSADSVVEGWLVRFAVLRAPVNAVDTTQLTGGVLNSPWAVTDASGFATKILRVVPTLGSRIRDTARVQATITYKGVNVKGSPITFVVPLAPKDS